jgi:hypothetical protein
VDRDAHLRRGHPKGAAAIRVVDTVDPLEVVGVEVTTAVEVVVEAAGTEPLHTCWHL